MSERTRKRTFEVHTPTGEYIVSVNVTEGRMLVDENEDPDVEMESVSAIERLVFALIGFHTGAAAAPRTVVVAREP